MRILHTADWHLGRVFHRVDLLEDQRHALAQLVGHVRRERPQVVLIAGDIYDRAVPPAPAVRLLDDVLSTLAGELEVPTLVIAGNHDSVDRLGFASEIMGRQNLHICARIVADPEPVVLEDGDGPVFFYGVPYPEPAMVREALSGFPGPEITDHDSALHALVARIWQNHPKGARAVLVTHLDVEGAYASDSERALTVHRSQTVRATGFDRFDYVALGHLHRPQQAGSQRARFSGSLLPYSFSETRHPKSATLVDLEAERFHIRQLPIEPRRRVRTVEGTLDEILASGTKDPARQDYLRVTLLDRGPLLEVAARLREVYPNVLEIERPFLQPEPTGMVHARPQVDGEVEQFEAFFSQVVGEPLDGALKDELMTAIAAVRREGS